MLQVRVGTKQGNIKVLDISKHAKNANDDSDTYTLVCAGVSSISIGLANAIDSLCTNDCEISVNSSEDDTLNHVTIRVVNDNLVLQTILQTGLIQLKTVHEVYAEYLDLKITEV